MSNAPLTVTLNDERPHDLSVAPSFSTRDTFAVELENRGQAVHVHLHVDDELSRVMTLSEGNHFVDGGQTKLVNVFVSPPPEPVTGKLKIVSGHGSETVYVDVTVNPSNGKPPVEVDETLSKPRTPEPEPSITESLADVFPRVDVQTVPLVLLALAALALAVGVASVFKSFVITLGAGVVVGGVLVALVLTVW
ncbi:hypothetical protein E6P09_08710 [Haloferax mediterranei ATCC 33500]|uniref:Uncharacterized protein n=1 Tax=Haloferax mediterranei (strain ATCC 33500 / DSM 1411 / JCM 8866 / NBRC 14739 / NCIMB 2177 / R-4) TaxID=523841 RepID=I3R3P4_HALMT|nr:hypothetical protein [Haloferax mediterranei]AFK18854.1 hypothetical protein HFX_1138 [Haloferax mediterranei ATCC 33500]AHZ21781.1 hypothetical protein BM92_03520 [Haloferax mediterranei ATCC 33500]EMA03288.1 hypothetical protein C439_04800 [Haloferax mediterranei ATCC 33500]MDX5988947.1 hypothetical protein [Haloferax mediterranei ATCC 33500]QCQ75342.1 hypothetical protein E6P09_08710 [Haloferax mediterranei ATCC 33500]